MSISETNIYDIGDIIEWVEERRRYESEKSLEQWKIMRVLATVVVNLVSKKPIKEEKLFKLGEEMEKVKRTPEELAKIEEVFKKWDNE